MNCEELNYQSVCARLAALSPELKDIYDEHVEDQLLYGEDGDDEVRVHNYFCDMHRYLLEEYSKPSIEQNSAAMSQLLSILEILETAILSQDESLRAAVHLSFLENFLPYRPGIGWVEVVFMKFFNKNELQDYVKGRKALEIIRENMGRELKKQLRTYVKEVSWTGRYKK